jgi:hypothetical protein
MEGGPSCHRERIYVKAQMERSGPNQKPFDLLKGDASVCTA